MKFDNTHTESERLAAMLNKKPDEPDDVLLFSSRDMYTCGVAFLIIGILGGFIGGCSSSESVFESNAVYHGAAHYNAKTGAWMWNAEKP